MSGRNPYCPFFGKFNSNECLAVTFAFQWESVRHELNYKDEAVMMLILGNGDGSMNGGGHHERPCFQKQREDDDDGQQSDSGSHHLLFGIGSISIHISITYQLRDMIYWPSNRRHVHLPTKYLHPFPGCHVRLSFKRLVLWSIHEVMVLHLDRHAVITLVWNGSRISMMDSV